MEVYLFQGRVLPERAQLNLQFALKFQHLGSMTQGQATVSVILNQVAVWVESESTWDILDLRNVVKNIVQNALAIVGYLKGFAYDFEITRVFNRQREVDYVFGIDIPCLAERSVTEQDVGAAFIALNQKATGPNGIFLHRCFSDLVSAMKNADDTGFYCYRAIESLRHHCAASNRLTAASKKVQWEKFREISSTNEEVLRYLKISADHLRHGDVANVSSEDRIKLFTETWSAVNAYLTQI